MIYLLLSILASTGIFICFKLFDKFKINTLQAIVVNYIIACLFGLIVYDAPIKIHDVVSSQWFYGAFFLGILFITVFNIMAITAQRNGLSVVSVASKMSVVIPIIFGFYVYHESAGIQKIIGIILALVAVYLSSIKPGAKAKFSKNLIFPILLFFGSGVIDTSIKYLETTYVPENGIPIFSASLFFSAAIFGVSTLVYQAIKKQFHFDYKSIIGGLILGIINYGSIHFLLKALHLEGLESSTIFTVNNVAIVMISSVLGLMLFKEHISRKNWIGIALAIISIALVTSA
ncbi:EamA family transporter [Flavobacteriaceae bacterium LMO-SS05]